MTNREIMLSALKKLVIPPILEKGYEGEYPHFMKKCENYIELISFETNKYGGSFYVETSVAFPKSKNKNYYLVNDETENELTVSNTNIRYRLKGMFDGQFFIQMFIKAIMNFVRSRKTLFMKVF